MKTKIIAIGNSRGVRLPKVLLEESGLTQDVELRVKKGEIRIVAVKNSPKLPATALLSEKSLSQDWNRTEEDEAWANL